MKIAMLGVAAALMLTTGAARADETPAAAAAPAVDSATCSASIVQAIEDAKAETTAPKNTYSGKGKGGFANALKAYAAAEKAVKAGCEYAAKDPGKVSTKKVEPLKAEKNPKDDACSSAIVPAINKAMEAIHESPALGHAGGKFATAMNQLSRARAQVRLGCRAALKPDGAAKGKQEGQGPEAEGAKTDAPAAQE